MVLSYSNLAQQRRQTVSQLESDFDEDDDKALSILLVEDDYSDMLMTLQAINNAHFPYELNRITHGDEVLPYLMNAMQERMPDLILLDMGLPGTNGFEILETLASATMQVRSVPIAIITMYSNFDYLNKTYDLPIYGYLTKPVKVDKMQAILTKVSNFIDTKGS